MLGNELASAGNIFAACQSEAETSELLKDLKQERHVPGQVEDGGSLRDGVGQSRERCAKVRGYLVQTMRAAGGKCRPEWPHSSPLHSGLFFPPLSPRCPLNPNPFLPPGRGRI